MSAVDKLKLRFIPWDDYSSNVLTSCDHKHLLDLILKGSSNWAKVMNHLTKKWSKVKDITSNIAIFYATGAVNSDNNRIVSENLIESYYKRSVYESIKPHPVFRNNDDAMMSVFYGLGGSPQPIRGFGGDMSPSTDDIPLVELYYSFTNQNEEDTTTKKTGVKSSAKRKRESKVATSQISEPLNVIDTNIRLTGETKGGKKSAQIPIFDEEYSNNKNILSVKVSIPKSPKSVKSPKIPKGDIISFIKSTKNGKESDKAPCVASSIFSSFTPIITNGVGTHYIPPAITVPKIRMPSQPIQKSPKRSVSNAMPLKPQPILSEDSLANALFSIVDNIESGAAPVQTSESKHEVLKNENTNTFDAGAFAMLCDYTNNGNNFQNIIYNGNSLVGNSLLGNNLHFQQLKSPCSNSKSVRFNMTNNSTDGNQQGVDNNNGSADKRRKLFDSISNSISLNTSTSTVTPSTCESSAVAAEESKALLFKEEVVNTNNDNIKNDNNNQYNNEKNSNESSNGGGGGNQVTTIPSLNLESTVYLKGQELFIVPQTGEISRLVKRPVMPPSKAKGKGKAKGKAKGTSSKATNVCSSTPITSSGTLHSQQVVDKNKKKRRITPTFVAHLADRHKLFMPSNIQ